MDTAAVDSRPAESVLNNSRERRRSSQMEAEAKVRALIEQADDDPDLEVKKVLNTRCRCHER